MYNHVMKAGESLLSRTSRWLLQGKTHCPNEQLLPDLSNKTTVL